MARLTRGVGGPAQDGGRTGRGAPSLPGGNGLSEGLLRAGYRRVRLTCMVSSTGSNPEDEYADDEYADHDAEDLEQPSTPDEIPDEEPEADVLEQRQEVPYDEDDH